MVVGGSQQEILGPGFVLLGKQQQGAPVILRELALPDGFDPVSSSYTELFGPRPRDRIRQGTTVPSRLQVHLADDSQVMSLMLMYKNDFGAYFKLSNRRNNKKKKVGISEPS
ncbi:unnamed protein product [Schistosoma margrebowiei]|uniref:Uncharacterized protein n=1 Tax=Schistosoma margrebowiei TaxID=48269 RepID=A0A183L9Z1_9TREM|nr:unnamed protein product [Schistosoma margrebowiei]